MSTVASSNSDLTINADGSGNDIKIQSNGTEVGSINSSGTMTATAFAGDGSSLTGISSGGGANPNMIVNGAMRISQRGTSESGITVSKFAKAPDRWNFGTYYCGSWTASQSTESPDGFSNSYKMYLDTSTGGLSYDSWLALTYQFEGCQLQHLNYGSAAAQSITVSFWAKTNKTGTYVVEWVQRDSSEYISKSYTVSNTNWNKYTVTFAGNTSNAFTDDNNQSASLNFWFASGTDYGSGTLGESWHSTTANRAAGVTDLSDTDGNEFYLTGVKMEVGTSATDYHHKGWDEELAQCQRYYYQITHTSTNRWGIDGLYSSGTGAVLNFSWTHPTTMRVAPTFTAGHSRSNTTYIPLKEFMNCSITNQSAGRTGIEFSEGTSTWDAEI